MGRDLATDFPVARETFAEADDALGLSLTDICWNGSEEELTRTKNAQPAILVHTVAAWRVISGERPIAPSIGAGHSLGEISAYVLAGTLSFADAVRLVRARGEFMYEAGEQRPGTMAAVLSVDDAVLVEICRRASEETGSVAVPANFNSPGQVVISGDIEGIARASELAREAGARKVIPLPVSGAFHSPLMAGAAERFSAVLDATAFADPAFPIISNVTTEPVTSGAEARKLLLAQLTAPVRWTESVERMIALGADSFQEIGPGSVLTGLLRRIDKSKSGRALGTTAELRTFFGEA
jgi:[acyl-carrier-protein] S-malonyltransferase